MKRWIKNVFINTLEGRATPRLSGKTELTGAAKKATIDPTSRHNIELSTRVSTPVDNLETDARHLDVVDYTSDRPQNPRPFRMIAKGVVTWRFPMPA